MRTNDTKVVPAHTISFYLLEFHPAVKKEELKNHGSLNQLQKKENEWTLPHSVLTICRGNCAEIGFIRYLLLGKTLLHQSTETGTHWYAADAENPLPDSAKSIYPLSPVVSRLTLISLVSSWYGVFTGQPPGKLLNVGASPGAPPRVHTPQTASSRL